MTALEDEDKGNLNSLLISRDIFASRAPPPRRKKKLVTPAPNEATNEERFSVQSMKSVERDRKEKSVTETMTEEEAEQKRQAEKRAAQKAVQEKRNKLEQQRNEYQGQVTQLQQQIQTAEMNGHDTSSLKGQLYEMQQKIAVAQGELHKL
jgi:flagellar biosynthesis/type III secretory pathway protein FliH